MENSIEHKKILGKIVQVVLLKNGNEKVTCEIHSEHTQVGDNNKAYISRQIDSKGLVRRLDLNDEIPSSREVHVEAECVQVIVPDGTTIFNIGNGGETSTVQIGRDCVLRLEGSEGTMTSKGQYGHVKTRKKPHAKKPKEVKEREKTLQISKECVELCKLFFEIVLSVLHPLRDDGKWDIFDDKLNEFRQIYRENRIWQILLTLEQGLQMCYHSYQSNISEAEKVIRQELAKLERLEGIDPSITSLCKGRANCYLAAVYRRGKLCDGKVQDCLLLAEKHFKDTDFLYDKATMYYEKASWLFEFSNLKSDQVMQFVKNDFDQCAELCEQINNVGRYEFVRKGYFAKLKKVMLLLDCSQRGRTRNISKEYLEEAGKCLEELDFENNNHGIESSISIQLQFLLAKSDSSFRLKDNEQAEKLVQEAKLLAEKHGFDASPALRRLKNIQNLIGQADVISFTRSPENDNLSAGDADASGTTENSDCLYTVSW